MKSGDIEVEALKTPISNYFSYITLEDVAIKHHMPLKSQKILYSPVI